LHAGRSLYDTGHAAAPEVSIDAAGVQGHLEELTGVGVTLNIGGSVHDPTDPVGRLLFNASG
jgi:hypothetical protein